MNNLSQALNSPFRTFRTVNQGIQAGLVKRRDMSRVTLHNENRPRYRPILKNHWACYMSGENEITELSFHPDGITIKVWEKDLQGKPFIKEAHNAGWDMGLVWNRFEHDVRFGRARLSDDSSSFNRFVVKSAHSDNARTVARKDGVNLMVKWLNRQARYISAQCEKVIQELDKVGKAMGKGAFIGFASYSEQDAPHVVEKRIAQATAQYQTAVHNAIFRGRSMPTSKVSEVLDAPPTALLTKQSSLQKLEGNYAAGVGNKGQLDSFRSSPRNTKAQAQFILAQMAERQYKRAQEALDSGNFTEGEKLFKMAEETENKANALKK